MTKNQFYNVINKAPNNDTDKKYEYKNWNDLEKSCLLYTSDAADE